jgi:hypothetical protein
VTNIHEYETKRILLRIEAILSVEEDRKGELRSWIKQCKFKNDLASFYDISEKATFKLNTQWMKAILAALPDKFWSVSQDGIPQLDQTGSAASLRLLSNAWDGEEQQESVLHQAARKEVMQALFDRIPMPDQSAYREMFSWREILGNEGSEVSGDTSFGLVLIELELMMEVMFAEQERIWRIQSHFDESLTTPVEEIEKFSTIALRQTFYFMLRCWDYGNNKLETPDSLLALLSANMSCNKIVLEYAAMNNRGLEALEMTVSFLGELNAHGVKKVPPEFDFLSPAECDDAIFTLFQRWFGHNGDFIRSGTSFAKHMTNSDIQLLVNLSRELQKNYITTRGCTLLAQAGQAQKIHGSSTNRFIFALVLAAAFYSKARTDQEFIVGKNASYSVFPARRSIKHGDLLTIHAKDVLLKAYGLVFFGGRGWNLVPDDIEQYARGTEIRRSHNQLAILCAVKGRSCKELVALYETLKQLRVNPGLVFERLGMQSA